MPLFLVLMMTFGLQDPSVLSLPPLPDTKEIWIEHLHECENYDNVVKVLDSNNKYSYGYLQFQMGTWLRYSKLFGTTRENIGDAHLQKKVARYMLDNPEKTGGENNWYICSKRVNEQYGLYQ